MSSLHFRFRKIFHYEYEYNRYDVDPECVIFFRKLPFERRSIDRGDKILSYISKYRYVLIIDLWLLMLRFEWVGRERRAKA